MEELRETEKRLRAADDHARAELRKLRQEIDTVAADDVAAYAEALADGQGPPKARSARLNERVRDLEVRVIPGLDEALWLLTGKVVDAVQPDVNLDVLQRQMKRWAPPKVARDPSGVLPGPRTHDPRDAVRPADVVDWTLHKIQIVQEGEAKQRADVERDARYKEALRRVNAAQSAYNAEQRRLLDEREAGMSPTARNAFRIAQSKSQTPPWPDFDRQAFLQKEGLLEDYGWTQHGIVVRGGREQRIEQVPASEINATNSTEA